MLDIIVKSYDNLRSFIIPKRSPNLHEKARISVGNLTGLNELLVEFELLELNLNINIVYIQNFTTHSTNTVYILHIILCVIRSEPVSIGISSNYFS